MSDLLKQQCSFAKLRKKLEERKEKLCRHYKGFGHLAQNYRKEKRKRGELAPQNKFKVLASKVIKCKVELRRQEIEEKGQVVECFKCKEKGHKYRKCPEQKKRKETRVAHVTMPQKAQQKE